MGGFGAIVNAAQKPPMRISHNPKGKTQGQKWKFERRHARKCLGSGPVNFLRNRPRSESRPFNVRRAGCRINFGFAKTSWRGSNHIFLYHTVCHGLMIARSSVESSMLYVLGFAGGMRRRSMGRIKPYITGSCAGPEWVFSTRFSRSL